MAVAASITVSAAVTGLATGSRTFGPTAISASAPTDLSSAPVTTVVLASGANTITIPSTTCTACIIQFGSASTQTKTLKGVTGDTGIAVTKTGTVVLQFDSTAPASFVITAGGADTGVTTTIFWI